MAKVKSQELNLEKFSVLQEDEQQKVGGGTSTRKDFSIIIDAIINFFK